MPNIVANTCAAHSAQTLTKGMLRASKLLAINQTLLAALLKKHPSTIRRYASGVFHLRPRSTAWDVAIATIRVYRALSGLLGGNDAVIAKWMLAYNTDLGCAPATLIEQGGGVYQLADYLESYRGHF